MDVLKLCVHFLISRCNRVFFFLYAPDVCARAEHRLLQCFCSALFLPTLFLVYGLLTLWNTTNKSSSFPCKSPHMVTCFDIAVDAWFKLGKRFSRIVASFNIPATYFACKRLYWSSANAPEINIDVHCNFGWNVCLCGFVPAQSFHCLAPATAISIHHFGTYSNYGRRWNTNAITQRHTVVFRRFGFVRFKEN